MKIEALGGGQIERAGAAIQLRDHNRRRARTRRLINHAQGRRPIAGVDQGDAGRIKAKGVQPRPIKASPFGHRPIFLNDKDLRRGIGL